MKERRVGMNTDRKVLYYISSISLAALLLSLFLPGEYSGRITAAILLLPISAVSYLFIKKRRILSIYKNQILIIMSVTAVLVVSVLYLVGLSFGFYKNAYARLELVPTHVLPIAGIITLIELYRHKVCVVGDKLASVLCYVSAVAADVLIFGNVYSVTSFNKFMELMGLVLLPSVIANLLYHYITVRYGPYPNVVYRLVTTLYVYVIPVKPDVSDSLIAFAKLFIPIIIYLFIDALYEKKRRYALVKKSKLSTVLTVLAVAIMTFVVMLISNQFQYGTLVIATDSMTGEINKADAVIFEKYDDQIIIKGQVIAFEKNDSVIVHRVVGIEYVNGQTRYYTKGDINTANDSGYITKAEIMGVVEFKIPYIGYPTLWLRSLFDRQEVI